ncbi:MAG: tetratricopeptide repeat protein [Melioribacteraceae bacterium]|nr:tetratricopeptide repeat protein [Melioribacteraceae bacterium]
MKKVLSFSLILAMVFGLVAFQCSSTEITSARLYIQQKNWEKAKESLEKEISKNPKSDEGFYLLGFVNGELGDFDGMLANYEKSLGVSNKFKEDIERSKKFYWGTSFNKGVGFFNKATKSNDKDSANVFFDKSVESFQTAIKIAPDSSAAYKNLTFSYFNMGQTEKAIEPLTKLVDLTKSADSYSMLGEIYYNQGVKYANQENEEKSMEYFNKALSLLKDAQKVYPDDKDILLLLSNAYVATNKLDEAKDAFKAGVEKDPSNQYYRYNYGVLLLGGNEFAAAEEQFLKAVEIDPEYTNAHYNLGVTYLKWGTAMSEEEIAEGGEAVQYKEKYKMALPHFQKYLDKNPEDSKVWEYLGKVYANLGMMEESEEAFQKADQNR